MQHDIRFHETRGRDHYLYAWCICGQWTYQSELLNQDTPMGLFITGHLAESQVPKPVDMQPNKRGEWG